MRLSRKLKLAGSSHLALGDSTMVAGLAYRLGSEEGGIASFTMRRRGGEKRIGSD